ncbi:esterase [Aerococcus urinaehominis]|uniref:Esterase n=1 Tax=Aerococcus urinaehominis TaxID=128944 RepID=A0A109RH42_9LACT|nr:alpha/beta fold hydrolase [Aerococcus urinaehominis]AMB99471.1 esterase [Aerococcus urinaehominis]SDM27264.1 hypothetical protein SAMN04487985_11057 [Aerococcus urinaehominis]
MSLTIRRRQVGTIPLLEVVPRAKRRDTLPLIIYYHGWQSQKELNLTAARRLAQAGYRIILPDAENHGERYRPYSGIPSLTFWQSIHTNLMEFGYLLDHFQKLGLADDRIAVAGVSMGGITTCALMTHHPEIQAAACLMGTPQPLRYAQRIAYHAQAAGRYMPSDYLDLLAWINHYDLSLHPERLADRPFLIWHGHQDDRIPFDHARDFVAANPQANIDFIAEDEGHLVKVATIKQVVDFFSENFPI